MKSNYMNPMPLLSSFCMTLVIVFLSGCGLQDPDGVAFAALTNETDLLALLEFKAKISDDPLGFLTSWNESTPFCQWNGVTCSSLHQRVTRLDLQSQGLFGTLSPYIGNLSFLRILQLQDNSFSQDIPPQIGNLRRLETLSLFNNSFGGEIPANISHCSNLVSISIGFNRLVGDIPGELGALSKLVFLSIQRNNLTGSIPSSFGNLTSLETLSATQNFLNGNIPESLGRLANLSYIALGQNQLTGTLPSPWFNRTSMTVLDVGGNQIHGTLPSDLGLPLPNLQFLGLGINLFTGLLPVSLANASNLENLIITANQFRGEVPNLEKLTKLSWLSMSSNNLGTGEDDDLNFLSSLLNATSLELLTINDNNFGGFLPESIMNLSTSLRIFLIDNNQISGNIPAGIDNLINLERFEVWNNQLSGIIPPSLGNLHKLQVIIFNQNILTGTIPSSLGNLTELTRLHLARNDLEGHIPASLGNCKKLLVLDLSSNYLTGNIPPEVIGIISLSIYLGLFQNQLTGSLPVEVGNLENLGEFDISENRLSGEIPSTLGNCIRLEVIFMNKNLFRGSIPSSLSSLRGLRTLDLSQNNFSGQIPQYLEEFDSLQYLNLSYNDFGGTVPTNGVFNNASEASVSGNSKLCGGIPDFNLPVCKVKKPARKLTLRMKLTIGTVSGLVGVILALSILFLCWVRRKRKIPTTDETEKSFLKVSYQSLYNATGGFSSANLVGVGSFGSVYKGTLEETNGTSIAVKVLNLLRHGASKSFIAECDALRNIRHRNLLKVLTACSGIDYQGNDFKALVYEFMANGSLEKWLHPIEGATNFNILQRLSVASNIACALEYLHHYSLPPIAHCDLKPSNVLLDENMTAHVGDFGLAKFLSEAKYNSSSDQASSIGIRGTVGYAAPEYGMGSEVSTYGDAYSFGILLLEMITGMRPTDEKFKESFNLHNFAKSALSEQVLDIVDPLLLQEIELDKMGKRKHDTVIDCLVSIIRVGVACSAESPRERMKIADVVAKLHSIRTILEENS